MNNLLKLILPIAITLLPVTTQARDIATNDGNELLKYCTSSETIETTYCMGYIQGAVVTLNMWATNNKATPYCSPGNITIGQQMAVVVDYLNRHPATRNESAPLLILLASSAAWPCHST